MSPPKFFVIARVVGRDGAMSLWKQRLVHLCGVSATEPYGDSYYWGEDLDGEPDTLWGLEGYTHPIGFFIDHVSSDIFKREMALVDKDELLRTKQGLDSPDYDLHHYDQDFGWLKRSNEEYDDFKASYVVIHHFHASSEDQRGQVLAILRGFADWTADSQNASSSGIQSCLVLRECRDRKMATLWLRLETEDAYKNLESVSLVNLLGKLSALCDRTEVHHSKSFGGFLGIKSG
ncbi:hypothetical protein FBEOM_11781 [Fusarium beomiforme]|uniref:Uncharacterized protein n=1 Tax=Fusarium beomiforme TaxID=44412 RepID=A0A9P5A8Z5_9HYPO|nr:hypothetical protein FBEOM_11781 [Fusarium beomiforme]